MMLIIGGSGKYFVFQFSEPPSLVEPFRRGIASPYRFEDALAQYSRCVFCAVLRDGNPGLIFFRARLVYDACRPAHFLKVFCLELGVVKLDEMNILAYWFDHDVFPRHDRLAGFECMRLVSSDTGRGSCCFRRDGVVIGENLCHTSIHNMGLIDAAVHFAEDSR
jgi:hypothetical protein